MKLIIEKWHGNSSLYGLYQLEGVIMLFIKKNYVLNYYIIGKGTVLLKFLLPKDKLVGRWINTYDHQTLTTALL